MTYFSSFLVLQPHTNYLQVHVEKAVIQPRSPKKEILLLEESNGKGPETVCHDSYDGRIMIFNDSCASMVLEDRQQVCIFVVVCVVIVVIEGLEVAAGPE